MSAQSRTIVTTLDAPKPIAPYNQGVILDSTMYVSGVLGLEKETMKIVEGDVTTETRQALRNLGYILQAGNSSYDKVVKSTIFLSDLNDFAAVNDVYREFFIKDFPARSAFQVAKLPMNARVEIEVIAATGQVKTVCCH
ncbi:rutC family protein UK114-like [Anoplophora glabripennis]|uniref:rutC family protein UK114-like n=1 Tax=Anoplophora glabripennis TaxID=217634 RepID=UPI0008737A46|nr:rutC family protein UK114-like [Anoplophora glabripennis]